MSPASGPADADATTRDGRLVTLVAQALEMRDAGVEFSVEDLCKNAPELVADVEQALEQGASLQLRRSLGIEPGADAGTVLAGRYRVGRRLGTGAMGLVYRALDLQLDRWVAIKLVHKGLLFGPEVAERFLREARALAAVDHANLVRIFDVGQLEDGSPYLVMEWIDGMSLSEVLELAADQPTEFLERDTGWVRAALGCTSLPEAGFLRNFVRWLHDAGSALSALHAGAIVHRDVKPSNVMIRSTGEPVLLDLGLAVSPSHESLTRDGATLGTPAYLAPEALGGKTDPGPALDIYGLTATLYHGLTLQPPYRGSPTQILAARLTHEPLRAARLRPGLPRDLQAILDKGLERLPRDRYATVEELTHDLRSFLEHRAVSVRPLSAPRRTARRFWRSPPARVATLVTLVGLLVGSVLLYRAKDLEARRSALREVDRHIPALLGLGRADLRAFHPSPSRAELSELLDRAVELQADGGRALLRRASFRLDHGDAAGAARDVANLARRVDTAYAGGLADAYAHPSEVGEGFERIDLSGLPEPDTAFDHYLAGYHLKRANVSADLQPLLGHPGLSNHIPSLELLLKYKLKDEVAFMASIAHLERLSGGRTATTAHYQGHMLIGAGRYTAGYDLLAEAAAEAPTAHGIRINLGWAAYRVARYEEAIQWTQSALAIRPSRLRDHENLISMLMGAERFDDALRVAENAPIPVPAPALPGDQDEDVAETVRPGATRAALVGNIEAARALSLSQTGELSDAESAAKAALAAYAEAESGGAQGASNWRAVAEALGAPGDDSLFVGLLRLLRSEPLNHRRLKHALSQFPETLTGTERDRLFSYLNALRKGLEADAAAPTNPAGN